MAAVELVRAVYSVPFSNLTPTRYLWVATTGSGSGDGSPQHPYLTLQQAVSHAKPGTAIMVEAGTYVGNTHIQSDHSGTPTAPIWIISADGPGAAHLVAARQDPVIGGGGVSDIVVDGFWVSGGKAGIQFSQDGYDFSKMVSDIVVENNIVDGAVFDGIKANGGFGIYVLNNLVRNGEGDEGIDFVAINDSVIANNEITNTTGLTAMFVKAGSTNDLITGNYIHDVPNDGIGVGNHTPDTTFFRPGFTGYEASNIDVTGNVVVNAGGRALVAVGATDSVITDNFLGTTGQHYTVVLNDDELLDHGVDVAQYSRNLTIADNVLASGVNALLVNPGNDAGLVYRNNLVGTLLTGSASADHLTGDAGINYIQGLGGDDVLSGLAGDDHLHGGEGSDTLIGGPGDDTLDGGDGIDTASYADAPSKVTVNLGIQGVAQNTSGAGSDTLVSIENVIGSAFADVLYASAAGGGALYGGGGDDTIYAGAGPDTIDGGAGVNWAYYYMGGIASGVTVNLNLHGVAQNTGGGGIDVLSNIQNLQGSSFDDLLIGDGAANNLQGRAGDDTLDGGPGDDTLNGGPGVNTASYASASSGVTVSLQLQGSAQDTRGAGFDTLLNIQNLTGSAYGDSLTGDANNNVLDGGTGGDDTFTGGGGTDTVSYASATAGVTVSLAISGPQNTYGGGVDTLTGIANLTGSAYGDALTGNAGNNVLIGGAGDDSLIGGAGSDTLYGGAGPDRFVFKSVTDSTVANPDVVADFSHAQGDHINLTAIDANTNVAGDQAFTLVSGFTHAAGQLIEIARPGGWLVEGDVNGDGAPDFAVMVDTSTTLVASDFFL